MRRRLVLEVLVQLGALVYDGAARRVRAPAASGIAAGARRPEEKPQRCTQHWSLRPGLVSAFNAAFMQISANLSDSAFIIVGIGGLSKPLEICEQGGRSVKLCR